MVVKARAGQPNSGLIGRQQAWKGQGALYKRSWDEQVGPRYRAGEAAPGVSRERFLRLLRSAAIRNSRNARPTGMRTGTESLLTLRWGRLRRSTPNSPAIPGTWGSSVRCHPFPYPS
jgi:hypothetical protein